MKYLALIAFGLCSWLLGLAARPKPHIYDIDAIFWLDGNRLTITTEKPIRFLANLHAGDDYIIGNCGEK